MSVVQSVLGPIQPYLMGRVLTHEHINLDFSQFYISSPQGFQSYLKENISIENLGFVRQYPYSSLDNLIFHDERTRNAILKDLQLYKKFGGGTLVENTSHGLKRNLNYMYQMSKKSKVHIIAGTGHYISDLQDNDHVNMSVEQMVDLYTTEIINGIHVEEFGIIKCGFIGEVGSVYPLKEFEKRAIKATGETQEVIGCGVSFHPGRNSQAPFEIMRLYLEAGGKAYKCVMSHLDRTILDINELFEFAKLGSYLQYDLFGIECSFYQLNKQVEMLSDAQRICKLMELINEGLLDRILMSHDIHTKHRLTSFGGHGYHHIHLNVMPRLLSKGLTQLQIDEITITNPANWLQFKN